MSGSSSTTLTSLTSSWSRTPLESEMAVRHADQKDTHSISCPSPFLGAPLFFFTTILILISLTALISLYPCGIPSRVKCPTNVSTIIPYLHSTTTRHYHSFQFCSECSTSHDDESVVTLAVVIHTLVMTLMMVKSRPLPVPDTFTSIRFLPSFQLFLLLPLLLTLPFLLLQFLLPPLLLMMTVLLGSKTYYFQLCENLLNLITNNNHNNNEGNVTAHKIQNNHNNQTNNLIRQSTYTNRKRNTVLLIFSKYFTSSKKCCNDHLHKLYKKLLHAYLAFLHDHSCMLIIS